MNMIDGVGKINGNSGVPSVKNDGGGASGFGEILDQAVSGVNQQIKEADQLATGLVDGEHAKIHETMIALEKANISLRLMTKVQSKVVSAYQEIMRMQL
ncbi:MAG: flagellar hook-basal body complex protein FliE [Proteobacteria bacterium]|nr:flagellar hook-basal body complex protein FliE [Pseudomonadota bacterium]MBU1686813.1 flagellar hook-basal body complex protein FliE [Pseudomonadota bacterium]